MEIPCSVYFKFSNESFDSWTNFRYKMTILKQTVSSAI